MIACIVGEIISIDKRNLKVQDFRTKEIYECEADNSIALDLRVGDNGVFIGQYVNGTLSVNKIEIRKFLDPLYESDLYDASGKFNIVAVINDPFTESYLEFLERQREKDAEESTNEPTEVP
jgi:hypothetical protein